MFGVFWLALVSPSLLRAQTISVLHSFVLPAEAPTAPLVQGPDGTLYGTASTGGAGNEGTVFKVNPNGTGFTNLYNFSGGVDGAAPYAGLLLAGTNLFGTACYGGSNGSGTVFHARHQWRRFHRAQDVFGHLPVRAAKHRWRQSRRGACHVRWRFVRNGFQRGNLGQWRGLHSPHQRRRLHGADELPPRRRQSQWHLDKCPRCQSLRAPVIGRNQSFRHGL